jgi:hypothetical protein
VKNLDRTIKGDSCVASFEQMKIPQSTWIALTPEVPNNEVTSVFQVCDKIATTATKQPSITWQSEIRPCFVIKSSLIVYFTIDVVETKLLQDFCLPFLRQIGHK